ncbi:MAG: hypothetical protein WC736_15830 [Gallionella sp.]|jgi:hypothetical protein
MELEIIKLLLGIAGSLIGLLTVVVGWIGVRIHSRLDSISKSLQAIERDLRSDLSGLDRRVVRLEVQQGIREESCG